MAKKTGHSTLTPVLDLAREADLPRLVLTHFDPDALDPERPLDLSGRRGGFEALVLAEDGMTISL